MSASSLLKRIRIAVVFIIVGLYWQLIDSSFGIACFFPAWLTLHWTRQLECMGS